MEENGVFELNQFIKIGILDGIKNGLPTYQAVNRAYEFYDKGVFSDADMMEIMQALKKKEAHNG